MYFCFYSFVRRFELTHVYFGVKKESLDDAAETILLEEFMRLVIAIVKDRTMLCTPTRYCFEGNVARAESLCFRAHIRREVIQILCTEKSFHHSDLLRRLPDTLKEMVSTVNEILLEVADFSSPVGTRQVYLISLFAV